MSSDTSDQPTPQAEETPRRKGPPLWGVAVFLVLLAVAVVLNHLVSVSGPKIQWVENDLDGALQQVSPSKPRLFLYLYEPHDPVHARNEREVFANRWAKKPLAKVVCCRVAVRKGDALAEKYSYQGTPLFLLLDRSGRPTMGGRTEGGIGKSEFDTYIGMPIDDAARPAP